MRIAHFMGKDRGFEDCGGLCSPGRWSPDQRTLPVGLNREVLAQARALLEKSVQRTSEGKDVPLTLMLKLATGRITSSPLDPGVVDEVTDVIARFLGCGQDRKMVDEQQASRLPLIADLLRSLGDPDWSLFEQLREWVPFCVNCELPRTPEVFEEKLTWALDELSDPLKKEATNCRSVEGYEDHIRKLFEEEAAAEPEFGKDLHIAALAVVVEPEKIWVVQGGTNKIHVNNCIRVRDRVRSPTAGELRALMREKYEKKNRCKLFLLVGDVSKGSPLAEGAAPELGVPGMQAETWFDLVECGGHVRGQLGRILVVEIITGVVGPFVLLRVVTSWGPGRTTVRGRHLLHCWEQTGDRGPGSDVVDLDGPRNPLEVAQL